MHQQTILRLANYLNDLQSSNFQADVNKKSYRLENILIIKPEINLSINKFYPKNKLFYISFLIKLEKTTFEGLIKRKKRYTSLD